MATCFAEPSMEDDTAVLFSTSNSPEESTSPSSTLYNSSPPSHRSCKQTHHQLTVKNLSYSIHNHHSILKATSLYFPLPQKPKPITILNSISFSAQSSEILAVVGPSGTGKSSLLRIISGRMGHSEFDRKSIWLDDCPIINPNQLRKICGFVAQEDNLLPLLTVKETLEYSAMFRLKDMSRKEKEGRVESLMQELGLVHVADSYVGDEETKGISGGERKRVSIGADMIHEPPILLLDEPTSGLDSTSALQVMEMLSTMARTKKRMVILTIHQPSYRILQYVSNLMILSHGTIVHNGSLQLLEEKIAHLGYQIPLQLNPLEFAMEIISKLEESSKPKMTIHRNDKQCSSYLTWRADEIEIFSSNSNNKLEMVAGSPNYIYTTMFEIFFLCLRFWKIIYRTKQLLLARTMQAIVGGLGLGSVYVRVKKDEGGVAERLGLFAFSLSFLLSSTVEALPIYLQERHVLMKEVSRGAYKVSSYVIANTIVFLPFLLVVAILFAIPVYWIVGLNPSLASFAFFMFVVWMIVLMASSLVLFLSAVSSDFIAGNSLICTVLGAFFLFSGYFIPKESIPKYWIFMYHVSLYRYPLDSLLINEYWSMREECFSWQSQQQGLAECALTGYDVLKSRGLMEDTRWINVGIMFAFFLFYRLLCWVVLARRASKTTI